MPYTFIPKEKHAKAYGSPSISYKTAMKLCRAIRRKKLSAAKRLLEGLEAGNRTLGGKYHTKTAKGILYMINSCEKNAVAQGLDTSRLFVYASPHQGPRIRRRRRKSSYGSLLKRAHLEIILIEQGKAAATKSAGKVKQPAKEKAQGEREERGKKALAAEVTQTKTMEPVKA